MTRPTVLITGARGGIGAALIHAMHAAGAYVIATDVTDGPVPTGAACACRLDVRSEADWNAVVALALARFGQLDVLFNLAGIARAGHFVELSPSEIDRHLDINFKGAALGMRVVLPHLIARGRGHIVNVGSLAAVAPVPGIALYTASKFALRGLSLAVAAELAGTGVAVTVVEPDLVDTPMIAAQIDQPEAAYSFSGGRTLTPAEVASVLAGRVLRDRPLEVALPTHRGVLAQLAGTFPRLARTISPHLRRRGLARQAHARRDRDRRRDAGEPT